MWVDPITYVNGDTITGSIIGVYWRDDLIHLHSPPRVRAVHDSNQTMQGQGVTQIVDFSRTIYDNDGMHGGEPSGNEPPSALLAGRTVGNYILGAGGSFEQTLLGSRSLQILRRLNGDNSLVPNGSGALKAKGGIGDDGNQENFINIIGKGRITTVATHHFCCAARMVNDTVDGDSTGSLSFVAEIANGLGKGIPYFFAHWRGGP